MEPRFLTSPAASRRVNRQRILMTGPRGLLGGHIVHRIKQAHLHSLTPSLCQQPSSFCVLGKHVLEIQVPESVMWAA